MTKHPDTTAAAQAGYRGDENPHMWSSAMWMAHEAGKQWRDAGGKAAPELARMSRGYSVALTISHQPEGQLATLVDVIVGFGGKELDRATISMRNVGVDLRALLDRTAA
jgi:hypothetical protein